MRFILGIALIYGLPVGVMLAYPILGKRLFSRAELRPAVLNQRTNSRPGYGKRELAYTPYNDGLIGLIRSGE